jgi:outer membrane receptor protein involved in Fe transport
MMRKNLFALVLALVLAACAFAQAGGGLGSISGVVQDATGASVPGAIVVVSNEAKGIHRTLETSSAGQFTSPALIPDAGYKVTVSKSGFSNYEATNITLSVGQNVDLHVQLGVATTTTSVDVSANAIAVEDTKTDVSQVVNQRQILDLPINARRVDSFVLLSPAVVPDGAFGLLSFRGIAGHNSFLTDGNDTTNQFYNENAGRTRITSPISQEAVQEFQVISDNFAAEYGNAMGGIVNTITKSGTNDIHGTGYWFFRNRTLNARDRYALFNPQDIRHQSGASVGGRIIKDKLFYYFNYEATRRNFPGIASLSSGMFNSAGVLTATCGAPASAAQCAAATNMILTRNFGTVSRSVTQDLGLGKLDYHLNDKNSLSFSLNLLRWVSPHGIQATGVVFNTGNLIGNNADSTVRDGYGRAQWTSVVTPTIVNEARFGWFHDRLFDPASDDFLFPGLGRAGLTVASTSNLGIATSYPRLNPSETRYEFADNLSWTKGSHTMKFGFNIAHTEDFVNQLSNQFGSYNYGSLGAFAADFTGNTIGAKNWNTYSQTFGNPQVDTNLVNYSFYGQDQWRVNSRLLFNYGLRYEFSTIPQPKIINPDYPQTGKIPSPKDNFSPRVGISYALTNDQKTLIRAGYGIFYARYQTGLIENLFLTNGVYQTAITYSATTPAQLAAGPVYPNNLAATTFAPPSGSISILFADKNLRNPYTHQANIGIERQLTNTVNLNVSYIWSRGVRLYGIRDLNAPAPGDPVTYTIQDASGANVGSYTTPTYRLVNNCRPDCRYRQISQIDNPGLSYYDGLAVQLLKRYSRNFQASVAYTWSHAIDFNQSSATNNIFFSSTPTSYANGDFVSEKGSAANDMRHRFVTSFVWDPTFIKNDTGLARYLVNHWQLSSVTTLQSSQPVNSTTNISGNAFLTPTGNAPLAAGSLNGLGGGFSRVPFQPVSNLNLDPTYRVDARLSKKLNFGERFTAYLTIEAINLFNTPYDLTRRTAEYDLSGASLTGAILKLRTDYATPSADALSPDGTTARRAQVSLRVTF